MDIDPSIRRTGSGVVATLVALLCVIALAAALALDDTSLDASRVEPIRSRHLASLTLPATGSNAAAAPAVAASAVAPPPTFLDAAY